MSVTVEPKVYLNQELNVTLICRDNDGKIIDLSGKTIHFLFRDPSGNETTDTNPTVVTASGSVTHKFNVNDLDETGIWECKVLLDVIEVPSTVYKFTVYDRWDN